MNAGFACSYLLFFSLSTRNMLIKFAKKKTEIGKNFLDVSIGPWFVFFFFFFLHKKGKKKNEKFSVFVGSMRPAIKF